MKRFSLSLLACAMACYAISVGDPAPSLTLPTLDGGTFNLANHRGEVVVLYTFGCT
jgi:peroxiredoxin